MKRIITSVIIILVVGLSSLQIVRAQGMMTYLSNLNEPSIGSVSNVGTSFVAGDNIEGYVLNSIKLEMADASGNPSDFTVMLYAIIDPASGTLSNIGALNGSADPASAGIYTYTASPNLMLLPDTKYIFLGTWIGSGAYEWSVTSTRSSDAYGGWLGSGFGNYSMALEWGQYAINATAIPEPGVLGLLGLGGLCFLWHRRKVKVL
jgi:PEP-CTERM motif